MRAAGDGQPAYALRPSEWSVFSPSCVTASRTGLKLGIIFHVPEPQRQRDVAVLEDSAHADGTTIVSL
jgi:hypothetical protein